MTYAPKPAFGTKLKIGDGASPTEGFTDINGLRNINGPEYSTEFIDLTHHNSAGNYRKVAPSFLTAGTVDFEMLYDSTEANHLLLFTKYEARAAANYQLVMKDNGSEQHAFSAYVGKLSLAHPLDDAVMMNGSLEIDGAVTRT